MYCLNRDASFCRILAAGCLLLLAPGLLAPQLLQADPCGMVPSIQVDGPQPQLTRTGHQQTYVFYKDGLETMVLRPSFSGNVNEFGLLIPFPSPPAIRKTPDAIFEHIAAAIDPPEVTIDLTPRFFGFGGGAGGGGFGGGGGGLGFAIPTVDRVNVLREEAVGMYEVAVLAAGSAGALRTWMINHDYRYPDGMDKVCDAYVEKKWCFVAVKTRVAQKQASEPQPGQRRIDNQLPEKAVFDGSVQAMGFRFPSPQLVVPMRLSVFNATDQKGKLRNVVYLLTDRPSAIRSIPEEYVRRQIHGQQLVANLTQPLPLRVIGGSLADVSKRQRQAIALQRNPAPHNALAAELFTADLLAARSRVLMHRVENEAKQVDAINERMQLRGSEIDSVTAQHTAAARQQITAAMLEGLKRMTLTVVDGDFPRQLLAESDLTFKFFRIAKEKNRKQLYNARTFGPSTPRPKGRLYIGQLPPGKVLPDKVLPGNAPPGEAPGDETLAASRWRLQTLYAFVAAGAVALGSLLLVQRFRRTD